MLIWARTYESVIDFIRKKPILLISIFYIIVSLIVSLVLYLRYPNNFNNPNFYAEDTQYANAIIDDGFAAASFSPFNGYLIIGTYLIQGLSFIINSIFMGGEYIMLPRAISVASYVALGALISLPVLLLRKILHPAALFFLIVATTLIPIPIMDYGILGNSANLKFIFVYTAAILVIYRIYCKNYRIVWLIDLLILLCCLTNIMACFFLPLILLRYIPNLKQIAKYKVYLYKDPSFISFLITSILLVAYVVILLFSSEASISIGTIYDKPYQWSQTIEIFLARSYLFSFFYVFYSHLTDTLTIGLFLAFSIIALRGAPAKYRLIVLYLIISIFLITLFFILARPGLSSVHEAYNSGGFDQYYIGQSLIACLIVAFVFTGLISKVKTPLMKRAVYLLPFLIFIQVPFFQIFNNDTSLTERQGSIIENAHFACLKNDPLVQLSSYPKSPFRVIRERDEVCTEHVYTYSKPLSQLSLKPGGGIVFNPGGNDIFTQTFLSKQQGLRGITILVATYEKAMVNGFEFLLMDEGCKDILYRSKINSMFIEDGGYYRALFPYRKDSKNKSYCFSIRMIDERSPTSSIALYLTSNNTYSEGNATINGEVSAKDIVFGLLY